MTTLFIVLYFGLLAFVALQGVYLYWLIGLYLRRRNRVIKPVAGEMGRTEFPTVTVQLPIYNERRVALRLIEAVRKFDWPGDRLQIQVLDDSTDATSELIRRYLKQVAGDSRIQYVHRRDRSGYKAGALANGLKESNAEFVAVFDADNLPRPDFLMRTVPYFNDSMIGMVQTRWSFLNRNESLLCRAQGLFLDSHFHIEQKARFLGGLLFNFNGTAGIWRRSAIETSGGWHHDTLTEDLDLSMRAQLAGWKFIYDDRYDVPTELPNSITAFKSQQYRWSKGAVQTGIKLLPSILRSPLPLPTRIAALFYFSSKLVPPALLLLSLLLIPALYVRLDAGLWKLFVVDLPIFIAGTGSMSLFYSLAYRAEKHRDGARDLFVMPFLTSLGIALAVNNTRALLSALSGRVTSFVRTPKSGSTDREHRAIPGDYRQPVSKATVLEIGLAVYSTAALLLAAGLQLYFTIPFLATFAAGYAYFSGLSLRDRYGR